MNKRFVETSVGIFVLIGLVCVAYLTVKLGKMEVLGGDYYSVTARFDSITGLKNGAMIEIAGVPVGTVEAITLVGAEEKATIKSIAFVKMKIRNEVKIDTETFASVKTNGLIGDKYIRLEPGGFDTLLENGGQIINTESAIDIEELISNYAFGSVK